MPNRRTTIAVIKNPATRLLLCAFQKVTSCLRSLKVLSTDLRLRGRPLPEDRPLPPLPSIYAFTSFAPRRNTTNHPGLTLAPGIYHCPHIALPSPSQSTFFSFPCNNAQDKRPFHNQK